MPEQRPLNAMGEFYDTLDTSDPDERERGLFNRLPAVIARALGAPRWAKHLRGIDPMTVASRAGLAKLPVLRKSDLAAVQKEVPPFGGLNVTPPGNMRRLFMSPGSIFEPEGRGGGFLGRRACAACGGASRRRCRAQLLFLSSDTGRLHAGIWEQLRSAAPSFRPVSAIPSNKLRRSRSLSPSAM